MLLDTLHPFTAAVKAHGAKEIMPTGMTTAELRTIDAGVRRQSFFSAQTLLEDLLGGYKEKIASLINPTTEQRTDRVTPENPQGNVTTGLNPAQARTEIKQLLASLNYQPEEGEAGTLKDLSSDARINLVLKTNVETAQGAGRFIQMNDEDVIDQFPAQELFRLEGRHKQRNWQERWRIAAQDAGDEAALAALEDSGRMVALKNSDIWDSLGSSDLFDDALDNPFPPFAFNSGMWVRSVNRKDAEELGLLAAGEKAEPHPLALDKLFSFAEEALN